MNSLFELQAVSDFELDSVFYILRKGKKIVRISQSKDSWKAWFYKDKFSIFKTKLSELLAYCERYYERQKDALFA
jgi:Fe-S cluster biosynthesis and repair protein YggX